MTKPDYLPNLQHNTPRLTLARADGAPAPLPDYIDGLVQRPRLVEQLALALADCTRTGTFDALILLDLDNFKAINQARGRAAGDALLQHVARRLREVTRGVDTVAALGSDEFAILRHCGATASNASAQAQQLAADIVRVLEIPHTIDGHAVRVTGSLGIVLVGAGTASVDELMRQADMAMYDAKAAGRNGFRSFDSATRACADHGAILDAELRCALREQQFVLYYQPIVDHARKMAGVEALVRWMHPRRGLVGPCAFIGQAEQSDLIVELGDWVLRTACRQLAAWQDDPLTAGLTMAVNISARHAREPDFVARVLAILAETGAGAHLLRLELTESMLLGDVDDIIDKMARLKARGIGFALDDFGTGYSSLRYLERLPITHIKIDRSFVDNMFVTEHAATIVKALIALAHDLGLDVVAEGVEREDQWAALVAYGCRRFQGFLFAPAVDVGDLRGWIG